MVHISASEPCSCSCFKQENGALASVWCIFLHWSNQNGVLASVWGIFPPVREPWASAQGPPPGAPGSPQGSPRGSLVILQWTYGSKLLVSPCLLRNHYYAIRVILCSVVSLYVLFFAKPRVSRGSWMHSPVYKRMGGGVYMGSGPSLLVKLGGPRFDDERA